MRELGLLHRQVHFPNAGHSQDGAGLSLDVGAAWVSLRVAATVDQREDGIRSHSHSHTGCRCLTHQATHLPLLKDGKSGDACVTSCTFTCHPGCSVGVDRGCRHEEHWKLGIAAVQRLGYAGERVVEAVQC